MPDSLSASTGSSAASRSDDESKTPSEASNYSDDEDRVGNERVPKISERTHQGKRMYQSHWGYNVVYNECFEFDFQHL